MAIPIISGLIDKLLAELAPFLAPLRGIWNLFTKFRDTVKNLAHEVTDSADVVSQIISEFKNFSAKPHFRSRVVSLPKAIEGVGELWNSVKDAAEEIRKLWGLLKEKLGTAETATDAVKEVEGFDDIGAGLAKLGPKLEALGGKLLGFLALVLEIFTDAQVQLEAINHILHDILTIIQDVDRLNAIFLQQQNKRKTAVLEDGSTIRLRVGSLHP